MKIIDRMLNNLAQRVKQFLPGPGGVGYTDTWSSGESYEYDTLEAAFKVNPWVNSAVDAIAKAMSRVPLKVYRERGLGLDMQREEVFTHPLVDLLQRPALRMTTTDFIKRTAAYIALDGEALIFVENGSNGNQLGGQPRSLQILKPRFISSVTTSKLGIIDGYVYRQSAEETTFAPEFIIHPMTFNPFDDTRGLPTIEVAKHPILLHWYMTRYAQKFFENSARPSGILTTEQTLTEEAAKIRLRRWNAVNQGVEKAHGTVVLDKGTSYQDIGTTNKDAEFLGLETLTQEQILAVFGVPPIVVGNLEDASYANARQQLKIFYEFTVQPLGRLIEDAINLHLIDVWYPTTDGSRLYVQFNYDGVESLQADRKLAAEVAQIYVNTSVMSPNEVRRNLNLPDRDGGDEFRLAPQQTPARALALARRGVSYKAVLPPTNDDQWFAFDGQLMRGERSFEDFMRGFLRAQEQRVIDKLNAISGGQLSRSRVRSIDPNLIFDVFDESAEAAQLQREVEPIITAIVKRFGNRAMAAVTAGEGIFRVADPRVKAFIEKKTFKLGADINDVTRRRIHNILKEAAADAASVSQVATTIRAEFKDMRRWRAVRIARTELVGASNGAAVEGYTQSGVVRGKKWLSSRDGSTRETHLTLDYSGETIPLDGMFSNGCSAPGIGPPEESINCRCTILPVLEDE